MAVLGFLHTRIKHPNKGKLKMTSNPEMPEMSEHFAEVSGVEKEVNELGMDEHEFREYMCDGPGGCA